MAGKYKNIDRYLDDLEYALGDADKALVLDARFDAEEHLSVMVEELTAEEGYKDRPQEAVAAACEAYGDPEDVAREYLKADLKEEKKRAKKKAGKKKEAKKKGKPEKEHGFIYNLLSPVWDWRMYLTALYLFLMFPIGIIYFVYIVVGFSVGVGLITSIIGIPLLILWLLSFLGIGWFHGRMTELMLGVRMPRSKGKVRQKGGTAWERFKRTITRPRLYGTLLYTFLMFPLGIIYFTVLVTFVTTALSLIFSPLMYFILWVKLDIPTGIPAPFWFQCLLTLLGIVMLLWTAHLVKIMGHLHGKLSRALLIRW